jgi:hypothetical protein
MPDWLEQSDFEGNFPDFRILRRKVRPFQDAPLGRIPADVEKVRGGFLPPQLKSSEELEKQTKGNHPE